ncbi:hypothetical protein [Aureivirga sp. CE67]|uniref:hypothetical protein n=1 Tax=Aureivirga sp. CE67 TaxID=1788983 RepID=UPI0018CB0A50|nr:hypothetical protein [Aureivirga sp. CE67]
MRYLTVILVLFLISCSKENNDFSTVDKYYKVISLKTINGQLIDLNNDGQSNSNLIDELTNFSKNPCDLEVKYINNEKLFSFYIPKQYIFDGFVEFAQDGFGLMTEEEIFENLEIDDENYFIDFRKIAPNQYKLLLLKKYYDFSSNEFNDFELEIIYEEGLDI